MNEDKRFSRLFDHSLANAARKCFQYHTCGAEGGTLFVGSAVEAINHYLGRQDYVEVDEDAVENAYLEVSREDEKEVLEDVFVEIVQQLCHEQK